MRRKVGALTKIETQIMVFARKHGSFHGYVLTRDGLIPVGSLYRALGRLESLGRLKSELEPAEVAEAERRPRRRVYTYVKDWADL